jgi:hypothetical protein
VISIQNFPTELCMKVSPMGATFSAHRIPLYLIILIIFGEDYKLLRCSSCSIFKLPVSSLLLCSNILLRTLLSNIPSLRSSLNVRNQVSHPVLPSIYTSTNTEKITHEDIQHDAQAQEKYRKLKN